MKRRGLTLIELLVVIAILAVLVALVVVAVVKVRAASQRAECSHNLTQLGIACHATHTQHKRMPPAFGFYPYANLYDGTGGLGNLFFHLLPFLQQHNLHAQARYQPKSKPQQNFLFYTAHNVHQMQVPAYNCPSDPTLRPGVDPATQYAPSSYAGNYLVFGSVDAHFASKNAQGKPQLGASFPDGMGQTILFAEKYASSSGSGYQGGCHWAYFQADCQNPFFAYYEPGRKGRAAPIDPQAVGPSSRFQVQPSADGCNPCLPATGHRALNVCLADGSVRNLAASVDRAVWWALVTPASGDKPGSDW